MNIGQYNKLYNESVQEKSKEQFWQKAAENLHWFKKPSKILDKSQPPFYRWYSDGEINICYNAIDRHQAQHGNKTALIWESPSLKSSVQSETYTYKQLYENVAKLAWVLKQFGVKKGDRVIIYLPNVPEAVFSMLACSRIGAIHVVVYGGYPAKELAGRIIECQPKLIITASAGIERGDKIIYYKGIVDAALEMSGQHNLISLIVQRDIHMTSNFVLKRDYDYYTALKIAQLETECEHMNSNDPLYILFSSGENHPKGIVHDHAGTAVYCDWQMKHILDIGSNDTLFSATDVGWIVGHIFMIYGAFIKGATTILYEGRSTGTPDNIQFWRIIDKYNVKCLFTNPTSIREIRKEDPNGMNTKKFKLTSLQSVHTTGEHTDQETSEYLKKHINKNLFINNIYIQQEIGGAISANYPQSFQSFQDKPGSVTMPCPSFEVHILDNQNKKIEEANKLGKVCLKTPLPPPFMLSLFNNDEIFMKKYLGDSPGYYTTGDAGFFDEDSYLWVVGRIDDIIKTGGKKLSMSSVEQVLQSAPEIVNAAVVSKYDETLGEVPVGFVVIEKGKLIKNKQQFLSQLVDLVDVEIGSYANFKQVIIVPRLPQTRNGEILRSLLKKIINEENYKIPPSIEDESVVEEIKNAIQESEKKIQKVLSPINTKIKNFTQDIDQIESPSYKRRYSKKDSDNSFKGLTLKLMK
ncbi:AMP-dependent synthetase/ligase (macronuclear) [Tetrahymena thermophila SB210]|uniref:AMP-dependent synthetase/ligase n=1 Tax=Tetrahymena thermophila (strain SB210) TaxID=312017 RepID=Q247U0_TETTS|nr:AMP-dependent synthetase/ligase [Tetrahymena thermophila SB210]EAS04010.1 AMP-dependent synthetase/ligase [Tetrahymena thermophila SB210]|eukprot:XP_001024255.1 AMP-dependent synthetase/ligase [Tetrahymena thermophila SB210]